MHPFVEHVVIFVIYQFKVDDGEMFLGGNNADSKQDSDNLKTPRWRKNIALSIWVHYV